MRQEAPAGTGEGGPGERSQGPPCLWFALWPAGYVLACYLYWPAMKVLGTAMVGSFHFKDRFLCIPHGGMDFSRLVWLSPLSVPIDLLLSFMTWSIGYVEEDLGMSGRNVALVWLSFLLAAAVSSSVMYGFWKALRYGLRRRSSVE